MHLSENVKNLSLISTLFLGGAAFGLAIPYPKLECGSYKASGHLHYSKTAGYVLQLRRNSRSPVELLLLGGEPRELFERRDTHVTVRISVSQPIRDPSYPVTRLQTFLRNDGSFNEDITLVEKTACK